MNKINIDNSNEITHIQIIKDILQKINIDYFNDALNTLSHIKDEKFNNENYIQLHFDEKWIFNDYIKKFVNIEPAEIELINFIKKLTKNKEISEDDERRFHDLIQKDTDFYISEIDKLIDLKEKDLLTI